ncbi:MAG: Gfo/Idh/MocA family oxidoreductase [Opitutus sp.]
MTKLRVCIFGAGHIAEVHLKALLKSTQDVEVIGICDIDAPKAGALCAKYAIPYVNRSSDDLLSLRPDLVNICTPPSVHAQLAIRALRAGSNVLVEKPLCASLAELDLIQRTERETGRFCATVLQKRYSSSVNHIRGLLQSEKLGRPLVAVCNTLWYRAPEYYNVDWRGKWSTELGGPTVGHGIHAMDQLIYMLGDWRLVRATAKTVDRNIEVEDVSVAIIEFANGCVATVINSIVSPREETYIRIDTQRGTVEQRGLYEVANSDWKFTAAASEDAAAFCQDCELPAEISGNHQVLIDAVLENVKSGERPKTSGEEAVKTADLLSSIYKSAFCGLPILRGTIKPGDAYYYKYHGGSTPARII